MTLLYTDPRFLEHRTGSHPENPSRLVHISRHLESTGLLARCQHPTWDPISAERLKLVHDQGYTAEVAEFIRRGGGQIEADTVVGPGSLEAASLAAGAVADAVVRVVEGQDKTAALPGAAAGPSCAACRRDGVLSFQQHRDWGPGGRGRAWLGPRVGRRLGCSSWQRHAGIVLAGRAGRLSVGAPLSVLSRHGRGGRNRRGTGLGATLNLPLPLGISRPDYIAAFTQSLEKFADHLRPQLVLLSAGFDSHRATRSARWVWRARISKHFRAVLDVARQHAGGRVVSVLEGGYNPTVLAKCVGLHLTELLDDGSGTDRR